MRNRTSIPTLIRSLRAFSVFGKGWEASFELGYHSSSVVTRHVAQLELWTGLQLVQRNDRGIRTAVLTESGRDILKIGGVGKANGRQGAINE